MRNFLFAILLSACATTGANHPVNVAHVRLQIQAAMPAERSITAMGHTTDNSAVVYTTSKGGVRQEETWVRDASGWKLDHSVAADGTASSNTL